jgi:hypothetical protein
MKFLIVKLLPAFIISSLVGPNILLSTLFSNTLNKRDPVSYPYKTTVKITAFHILIFMFYDHRCHARDKRF